MNKNIDKIKEEIKRLEIEKSKKLEIFNELKEKERLLNLEADHVSKQYQSLNEKAIEIDENLSKINSVKNICFEDNTDLFLQSLYPANKLPEIILVINRDKSMIVEVDHLITFFELKNKYSKILQKNSDESNFSYFHDENNTIFPDNLVVSEALFPLFPLHNNTKNEKIYYSNNEDLKEMVNTLQIKEEFKFDREKIEEEKELKVNYKLTLFFFSLLTIFMILLNIIWYFCSIELKQTINIGQKYDFYYDYLTNSFKSRLYVNNTKLNVSFFEKRKSI